MSVSALEARKQTAGAWFVGLQERLVAAMETLERECPGPFFSEAREPGRFELQPC